MDRCHLLSWEVIFYIFSISFQVAGAVLLIIKYCGNTMNMMLQEYFPEGGVILVEKNNQVRLEKEKLHTCASKIYSNRISFGYIALGYILSIFGDPENVCKVCLLMAAIIGTGILIGLEKVISYSLAKRNYKEDYVENLDNLEAVKKNRIIAYGEETSQAENKEKSTELKLIINIETEKDSNRYVQKHL